MFYIDSFDLDESLSCHLVYTEKGLVYLGLNEYDPPKFVPEISALVPLPFFRLRRDLLRYLEGEKVDFRYELDLRTTPFRKKVYRQLCLIPYGSVLTYKEIGENISLPNGQRAVGQAVGSNPLPIIVPCHRVVAQSGLGGFSLGLEMKRKLLAIESSLGAF